jgi:hypothetical protein
VGDRGRVVVFYVLVGLAASAAGVEYGLVGVAAGVIPLSAVALLLATMRSRTAESVGRLRDDSGDPDEDPAPGLGMDDQTPPGDTPDHPDSFDEPDVTPSGRWNTRPPTGRVRRRIEGVAEAPPGKTGSISNRCGPVDVCPGACSSSQEVKG